MRIVANREKLLKTFSIAASVANPRSPKEILTNVKLSADMTGVTLQATDTEIWIAAAVEGCDSQFPGQVLLPVIRVGMILKESSDEQIIIEDVGTEIHLTTNTGTFKLPSADPTQFPGKVPTVEGPHHEISARQLLSAIRRTAFATDPDSSRYALGGILCLLDGDRSDIIGTDGRRLAAHNGEVRSVEEHKTENQAIVPIKAARIFSRAIGEEGTVKIKFTLNDVTIEAAGVTVNSRLVEGRYPNWRQAIPKRDEWLLDVTMLVGSFDAVIRQAAITADNETRGVDFDIEEGTLCASATAASSGASKISMPIAYAGEPLRTKLDFRYLRDFLSVLDPASNFRLRINSSTEATLLSCDGYDYVVMPMALDR